MKGVALFLDFDVFLFGVSNYVDERALVLHFAFLYLVIEY